MEQEDIFNLYEPIRYYYNRKKQDEIIVSPNTSSANNLNSDSARISFEINNTSSFLLFSKAYLSCQFKLNNNAGTAVPEAVLEHNFFPRMFQQMSLEAGSNTIETIDEPGLFDTMLKLFLYPKDYGDNEGFIIDTGDGNSNNDQNTLAAAAAAAPTKEEFDALRTNVERMINRTRNSENTGYTKRKLMYGQTYNTTSHGGYINWPLHPLFGYLDHNKVSINLPYKLHLTKKSDFFNDIFYGTAASKIEIISLNLHIPQVTPSIEVETKLLNSLTKDIKFTFLKRLTFSSTFTNQIYDWNIQNSSNTPRYIIVAFKQQQSNVTSNNSKFWIRQDNNNHINKIQIRLNNDRFPIEPVTIEPNKGDVNTAFYMYETMCKTFGIEPQLDYQNFLTNYPIFCFDVSAHAENLTRNGVQTIVHIERNSSLEITGYCLVMEESEHLIKVIDRKMIRIE